MTTYEPMLDPNQRRLARLPIQHPEVYEAYKKMEACFWTAEEVDLAHDLDDWEKLSKDEKHFISHVLAFFAASDEIVNMNLAENLHLRIQWLEAKVFYRYQMMMEDIHSEMYSLLIDTYVKNSAEKMNLLNAVEFIPCVKEKAQWALTWVDDKNASFQQHLVAFAIVEGIFFSGSFCSIFWLKKQGKMPGLCFANELISRDEAQHQEFAALLYSMLQNKLEVNTVHDMIKSAVDLEKKFVTDALSVELLGINANLMTQYIECVADVLCGMLDVPYIYKTPNPFEWMELISLKGKTNFFEKRVGEYKKAGMSNKEDEVVRFDDDDF